MNIFLHCCNLDDNTLDFISSQRAISNFDTEFVLMIWLADYSSFASEYDCADIISESSLKMYNPS